MPRERRRHGLVDAACRCHRGAPPPRPAARRAAPGRPATTASVSTASGVGDVDRADHRSPPPMPRPPARHAPCTCTAASRYRCAAASQSRGAGVHHHADQVGATAHRVHHRSRRPVVDVARAGRHQDEPEPVGAGVDGDLGDLGRAHPADLDDHAAASARLPRPPSRRAARRAGPSRISASPTSTASAPSRDEPGNVGRVAHTGLGDRDNPGRNARAQAGERAEVGGQRAQVAVVDADALRPGGDRAVQVARRCAPRRWPRRHSDGRRRSPPRARRRRTRRRSAAPSPLRRRVPRRPGRGRRRSPCAAPAPRRRHAPPRGRRASRRSRDRR